MASGTSPGWPTRRPGPGSRSTRRSSAAGSTRSPPTRSRPGCGSCCTGTARSRWRPDRSRPPWPARSGSPWTTSRSTPTTSGSGHKTTRRGVYTERAARWPAADDVVLTSSRGEVTETTIANLAVRLDGCWFTPPVEAGCLPGVERGRLVEAGVLRERRLTPADLASAEELAVVSSLRGWRPAVLLEAADSRP
ncbi:aminotransferase class IV [Blastococcus sp. TML/C7B]|uniref:aminotransferase class IV n=1 Tax=Blastococcus sp. TML/C7B TaxID=2798728 RepID=UPI001F5B937B|nr:aminotransferase class IV [Blastococcus sp. TML/C7B]